jgi:hypothetical protein
MIEQITAPLGRVMDDREAEVRSKQTYFTQSVSAALIALMATLALVWEQASGAGSAPRPDVSVIRAGQRAVRLNVFEACRAPEKQKAAAERASCASC